MKSEKSQASVYKIIKDIGDDRYGLSIVLRELISFLNPDIIDDFVKTFRNNFNMNKNNDHSNNSNKVTEDFDSLSETYAVFHVCMTCKVLHDSSIQHICKPNSVKG